MFLFSFDYSELLVVRGNKFPIELFGNVIVGICSIFFFNNHEKNMCKLSSVQRTFVEVFLLSTRYDQTTGVNNKNN